MILWQVGLKLLKVPSESLFLYCIVVCLLRSSEWQQWIINIFLKYSTIHTVFCFYFSLFFSVNWLIYYFSNSGILYFEYCISMHIHLGAVVVVIVWSLDLQLPVQSVFITTSVVSSNPAQARCTRDVLDTT